MKTDVFDHDINDDRCRDCGIDLYCGCKNCYDSQKKELVEHLYAGVVRCDCAAVCRQCEDDIRLIATHRNEDPIELYKTIRAMRNP